MHHIWRYLPFRTEICCVSMNGVDSQIRLQYTIDSLPFVQFKHRLKQVHWISGVFAECEKMSEGS